MTTEYSEGGLSKKKLMAPLVVIMFCAVAITGAAYAYNSTVSGNGDISAQYFVIDMYDDKEGNATGELCLVEDEDYYTLDVYTKTDKTSGDATTWKYVAYLDEKTYHYYTYVQLKTNSKTDQNAEVNYTLAINLSINYPSGATGNLGMSQTVTVTDVEAEKSITPTDSKYTVTGNAWYKVEFAVTLHGGQPDNVFGTYDTSAAVATDVGLFDAVTLFKVSFTATDSA